MKFLAVFFGGGFGAITRYLLYLLVPRSVCTFPFCTLLANFFGCFIASALFTFFVAKSGINPIIKMFLITGFCGGLSTLSSLSLEVLEYLQSGDYLRAFAYIGISIIICVVSVLLGILSVKKFI